MPDTPDIFDMILLQPTAISTMHSIMRPTIIRALAQEGRRFCLCWLYSSSRYFVPVKPPMFLPRLMSADDEALSPAEAENFPLE